ncbi:hypothetical protein QB607_003210 [Clostridium botulinum]|nr:hypothetical protein [Clostridium botulinum]EKS4395883.1 hypothetical protein [Clostridium botulinum]
MNNLTFANGGIKENMESLTIEILSHNFHNPHCDIVCTYFMEGNKKIEVTFYKDIKNNICGHEVYYFNSAKQIEHFYSRNYNKNNIPKKYKQIAEQLKNIHAKINFGDYKIAILN